MQLWVSQEQVCDTLAKEGVAAVRSVVGPDLRARLVEALEYCREKPSINFRTLSGVGEPSVQSDLFRWRDVGAFRELATQGALPRLAADAMGVESVLLLEDQWFYSEAGSSTPSPWHQDHAYHPLDPWFLTVWIPLDPLVGPVGIRAAAGSHRGKMFAPVEFSAGESTLQDGEAVFDAVPDIDADAASYRVVAPQADPGDAVLLDSRTLHAAGGLCEARFRRLSIRYAHPDTRFTRRDWPVAGFWKTYPTTALSKLESELFPRIDISRAT